MSTNIGIKGSDVYTHDEIDDNRVILSTLLVRGCSKTTIETHFKNVLNDNYFLDGILIAFMTRNIRGGKGERDLFLTMFSTLYTIFPELLFLILLKIPKPILA